MSNSNDPIARALGGARDAAGVGRLAAALGYSLVEPPEGVPLDDRDDAGGHVPLARRHIASGGGIQVVLALDGDDPPAVVRAARVRALLGGAPRPVLLVWPTGDLLTVATSGIDGRPRSVSLSVAAPRGVDVDTLAELAARDDGAIAALARHGRALDRSALTRRFFRDFRAQRDAISAAWLGIPERARSERDQLALLFLSRLVFLYFLQRQGHLLERATYLIDLVRASAAEPAERSIFTRSLAPLFFGVLNTPLDARSIDARALGELPYLNGGLFERHALERAHPDLDLPDPVVVGAFEQLLERYRFTAREPGTGDRHEDAHVIQPEMLGRMFEGLMTADRRGATGTFYTPAAVVDRIVRQALQGFLAGKPGMDWRAAGMLLREGRARYGSAAPANGAGATASDCDPLLPAVRELRLLDPACGSGAFVLGALTRIARLRRSLGDPSSELDIRRDLASNALHGVDVEPDAALLCALRLWLALTPASGAQPVRPLPNLDHRVRQGDALLDPMDLAGRGDAAAEVWKAAALDPAVRRARRALGAVVARYVASSPEDRSALRERIARGEVRVARRWLRAALARLECARRALHARSRSRDLFGARNADRRALHAEASRLRAARAEIRALERRLREEATLPFFSFGVHFAASGAGQATAGFDVVVSNPPWVRSHSWPRAFSSMIRSRYRVCRATGWRPARVDGGAGAAEPARRAPAGGQVDLALLFVERGLDLLRPGGVLALLLPAKSFRSLSAGAARAIVTERARVLAIEDHALDHRAIFRADAFAGVLVARATDDGGMSSSTAPEPVRVTMTHRTSPPLRFRARPADLSLDRADSRSPWLIVPPDVGRALRAMQKRGLAVGGHRGLIARRGAMTGANELLLFDRAERKLGDAVVAWPRASSESSSTGRSVLLRTGDLCPIVRGSGIRPFRFVPDGWVAWCHDDATAAPREPSPRLARHLGKGRPALRARTGWRSGLPDGVLFRLDRSMLTPRVAWRDIAQDLEVVRIPARVRSLGEERPLIALNTVYFMSVHDDEAALALTALLTSLPCRVFARSIAERAKDARFRFLGWTVETIPLPPGWQSRSATPALAELGARAHAAARDDSPVPDALRAEIDAVVLELFSLSRAHADALARFDHWLAGRGGRTHTEEPR